MSTKTEVLTWKSENCNAVLGFYVKSLECTFIQNSAAGVIAISGFWMRQTPSLIPGIIMISLGSSLSRESWCFEFRNDLFSPVGFGYFVARIIGKDHSLCTSTGMIWRKQKQPICARRIAARWKFGHCSHIVDSVRSHACLFGRWPVPHWSNSAFGEAGPRWSSTHCHW